ncbi:GNAT domain-containing protein [Paraphoma chrysanthemicola]|nr:GNAT domain-containing protein [Paraphoma chrysanthemicola]
MSTLPIPSTISTPHLTLLRLTDTSPSPSNTHLQYFHENWTDPDATSWSLHGPCHSLEESQTWMVECLVKRDNLFYSIFVKPDGSGEGVENELGTHVGSIGLRRQDTGPTLPAPPLVEEHGSASEAGAKEKEVDLRVIGYALFKRAWGKGYATEAAAALLKAYTASVAEEKAKGEKAFYVEAGVDEGNPASDAVLRKVGFKKVGWKTETESVFLGGEWRSGGYWIYGQYV